MAWRGVAWRGVAEQGGHHRASKSGFHLSPCGSASFRPKLVPGVEERGGEGRGGGSDRAAGKGLNAGSCIRCDKGLYHYDGPLYLKCDVDRWGGAGRGGAWLVLVIPCPMFKPLFYEAAMVVGREIDREIERYREIER